MGLLEHLFRRELRETREQGHQMEIVAVTGPNGVSASRISAAVGRQEESWEAGIMLTAWRLCDASAPVREEPRRLTAEADDERLKWLQRMIRKDSVVRLRVREMAGGFELEEVLDAFCNDAEMLEILSRQQEPVYYEDELLGRFELNKGRNTFEQQLRSQGMEVRLIFEAQEESRMLQALETARELTANLEFWLDMAAAYAADQLLELKNESWLAKDEAKVSREEFLSAVWLNDIEVMPGGDFRFLFSDGGMFRGHAIYVLGHVSGRFFEAGI